MNFRAWLVMERDWKDQWAHATILSLGCLAVGGAHTSAVLRDVPDHPEKLRTSANNKVDV